MKRRFAWLLPALTLMVTGGCDNPIQADESVVGSYTLVSVDGSPLPVTLSEAGTETVEVTGASLSLTSHLECTLRRDYRTTTGGAISTSSETEPKCNWTRTGTAIFLTLDVGAIPGTWDETAETVTFTLDRHQWEFQR